MLHLSYLDRIHPSSAVSFKKITQYQLIRKILYQWNRTRLYNNVYFIIQLIESNSIPYQHTKICNCYKNDIQKINSFLNNVRHLIPILYSALPFSYYAEVIKTKSTFHIYLWRFMKLPISQYHLQCDCITI